MKASIAIIFSEEHWFLFRDSIFTMQREDNKEAEVINNLMLTSDRHLISIEDFGDHLLLWENVDISSPEFVLLKNAVKTAGDIKYPKHHANDFYIVEAHSDGKRIAYGTYEENPFYVMLSQIFAESYETYKIIIGAPHISYDEVKYISYT